MPSSETRRCIILRAISVYGFYTRYHELHVFERGIDRRSKLKSKNWKRLRSAMIAKLGKIRVRATWTRLLELRLGILLRRILLFFSTGEQQVTTIQIDGIIYMNFQLLMVFLEECNVQFILNCKKLGTQVYILVKENVWNRCKRSWHVTQPIIYDSWCWNTNPDLLHLYSSRRCTVSTYAWQLKQAEVTQRGGNTNNQIDMAYRCIASRFRIYTPVSRCLNYQRRNARVGQKDIFDKLTTWCLGRWFQLVPEKL